jgi:polyisoprenyl-phosphate glycosyltransferase
MKLSLICPVFNEESALPLFYQAVRGYEAFKDWEIEIVFVNDGSADDSAQIISKMIEDDPLIISVNFSRNFGKEAALFAGMSYATGDAVIPIDVDLQDPIDVIPELVSRWREGAEVVLARRSDRTADSFLKRRAAEVYYDLHNFISDVPIEKNVGDFRLMDKKVAQAVLKLPERNLFMKGVLSWVGFKTEIVDYSRAPRTAGTSKFNGWKLWNFALDGVTSFSTLPLRLWTYVGLFFASGSFMYAAYMIVDKLLNDNPVPGYPSLMTVILFLGGIQLIGLGVLGEYIGRIYSESKQRPRYIISDVKSKPRK